MVGTPNETHYPLAKQALEAGKHVVVDKPFAATSAEARELMELAQEMGLVLAPFHNRRWDGDFLTVKKLLAGGKLGRLVSFESHFDRFRPVVRGGDLEGVGECGAWAADGSGAASGRPGDGIVRAAEDGDGERPDGPGRIRRSKTRSISRWGMTG